MGVMFFPDEVEEKGGSKAIGCFICIFLELLLFALLIVATLDSTKEKAEKSIDISSLIEISYQQSMPSATSPETNSE